jgi:hypothetical protein
MEKVLSSVGCAKRSGYRYGWKAPSKSPVFLSGYGQKMRPKQEDKASCAFILALPACLLHDNKIVCGLFTALIMKERGFCMKLRGLLYGKNPQNCEAILRLPLGAPGIVAESPQEAQLRFRGLGAEIPFSGASRRKGAQILL